MRLAIILLGFSNIFFVNGQVLFENPDFIYHLEEERSEEQYGRIKATGHFNNDSFVDLVILAPKYHNAINEQVGAAFVFYGNENGFPLNPNLVIEGNLPVQEDKNAFDNITVCDLNNDGFDDFAIGSPFSNPRGFLIGMGQFFVFFSYEDGTGIDPTSEFVIFGSENGRLGYLTAGGDVNGDGISDLVVSRQGDVMDKTTTKIYIYLGGGPTDPLVFDDVRDFTLGVCCLQHYATKLHVADINGDNIDDIITTSGFNGLQQSYLQIYLGRGLISNTPDYTKLMRHQVIHAVKDANADGFDDIIYFDQRTKNSLKFIKGQASFDTNDSTIVALNGGMTYAGSNEFYDINCDGFPDALISLKDTNGRVITKIYQGVPNEFFAITAPLATFQDNDSSRGSSITIDTVMPVESGLAYYGSSSLDPFGDVLCSFYDTGLLYTAISPSVTSQGIEHVELKINQTCSNPQNIQINWLVNPPVNYSLSQDNLKLTFSDPSSHLVTYVSVNVLDITSGATGSSTSHVLTAQNTIYYDYNNDSQNTSVDLIDYAFDNWPHEDILFNDPNQDGECDIRDLLFLKVE